MSFRKRPISLVTISLVQEDKQRPDERDWSVVATRETDDRGIAEFFAIPSGTYKARVEGGF